MKATAILKDLSDAFYNGNGGSIPAFLTMKPRDQFQELEKLSRDLRITFKFGSGAFRDHVEFNSAYKAGKELTSKVELRRGYRLVTFEVQS